MIDKTTLAIEEEKRRQKNELLSRYAVIDINEKSGIRHVNCVNLANLILNESGYYFKTVEDINTGRQEIFYYEKGRYYGAGENRIKTLVDFYLDDLTSKHRKAEIIDYIRNKKPEKRRDIEPPLNLVNLKNGIYDIFEDKLISHSHVYFFMNQLPIIYDKNADCKKIKQFFNDVLYKKEIDVMQEIFGFLVYRDYFLHKAILFLGGGRNGKGTTINLMTHFLGYGNYSTRELHELVENRFAKKDLYGKYANLGAETSGKALFDTGIFKNLTGGEPIYAEPKGHTGFTFKNYAKLIFNSNHIPYCKYDKSFAFFQRWLIVVFPETFEIGGDNTDPTILEKLKTEEELSGLFNWAMKGLRRILKNHNFSLDIKEDEAGEWYELLAYPEKRFIKDHLIFVEDGKIIKEDVYSKYEKWARDRSYPVLTLTSFTRSIKSYFNNDPKIKEYQKECSKDCKVDTIDIKKDGKKLKGYKNINWKNVEEKDNQSLDFYNPDSFVSDEEKEKHLEEKYY